MGAYGASDGRNRVGEGMGPDRAQFWHDLAFGDYFRERFGMAGCEEIGGARLLHG